MLDLLISYCRQHPIAGHPPIPIGRCEDLSGKTFGRLMVIYRTTNPVKYGRPAWLCICGCSHGEKSVVVALATNLKSGRVVSCGCKGSRDIVKTVTRRAKTVSLVDLSTELGIPYATLHSRVRRHGSNVEDHKTRSSELIAFKGKTQSLKAWAQELGIKYHTLYRRIRVLDWPVQRAFMSIPNKAR